MDMKVLLRCNCVSISITLMVEGVAIRFQIIKAQVVLKRLVSALTL